MATSICRFCRMQHCCFYNVSLAVRRARAELRRLVEDISEANLSLSDRLQNVVWQFLVIHLGWPQHEEELQLKAVMKKLYTGVFGLSLLDLQPGHSLLVCGCPLVSEIAGFVVWPEGTNESNVAPSESQFFHQTLSSLLNDNQHVPVKLRALSSLSTEHSMVYDRILVSQSVQESDLTRLCAQLSPGGRLVAGIDSSEVILVDEIGESFNSQTFEGPISPLGIDLASVRDRPSTCMSLKLLALRRLTSAWKAFGRKPCSCGIETCLLQPSRDVIDMHSVLQRLLDDSVSADVSIVEDFVTTSRRCLRDAFSESQRACTSGRRDYTLNRRMVTQYRCGFVSRTAWLKQREALSVEVYFYLELWNIQMSIEQLDQHRRLLIEAVRQRPQPSLAVGGNWGGTQDLTVLGARLVSDAWALRSLLFSPESSKLSGVSIYLWTVRLRKYHERVVYSARQGDLTFQKLCFHIPWLREMYLLKPLGGIDPSFFIAFEVLRHTLYYVTHFFLHLPQHHFCDPSVRGRTTVDIELFEHELARLDAQVPERIENRTGAVTLLAARALDDISYLLGYLRIERKSETRLKIACKPSQYLRTLLRHLVGNHIDVDCLLNGIDVAEVFE